MKALRKIFQNPAPTVLVVVLTVIALFSGACHDDKKNEQEGDDDAKQGEFRVSVQPDTVTLSAQNPSATVTITGTCTGKNVSPPCGSVNWYVTGSSLLHGTVEFGDRTSYTTTLKIAVDWEKEVSDTQRSSLGKNQYSASVFFNPFLSSLALPYNVRVTGTLSVKVVLVPPEVQTEQQEQKADKPRLTVSPQIRAFSLGPNDESQTLTLSVNYSGPPNSLSVGDPADKGVAGSAAKFTILTPRSVALPGDGTPTPPILINFKVDKMDYNTYEAALFISADNARPVPVKIRGTRYRF